MNPEILEIVPWQAPMPSTPQTVLITLTVSVALASIWFIFKETKRRKDWIPVYAFLGAGLSVVYEPLGDMLVSAFYPMEGQIGWIKLFGRQIPLFIGVLYFWYMSVPAIYFLKRLETGISTGVLWRMYLFTMALAIGIELFGVNVDAWIYYGPHPFMVFGVPLWATFTYGGFTIAIAVGLHLIATNIDRKHHWIIIPAIPLFLIAGHCPLSLPTAAAMFSTDNPVWIWLGGSITIGLSLLFVHVISLVYCDKKNNLQATYENLRQAQ